MTLYNYQQEQIVYSVFSFIAFGPVRLFAVFEVPDKRGRELVDRSWCPQPIIEPRYPVKFDLGYVSAGFVWQWRL